MKVTVNGREKTIKAGATLADAIKGEPYHPGSLISVHLSTERLTATTDEFELITSRGPMVLSLDDSDDARLWKSMVAKVAGVTARWVTHDIAAFGSFKTDIVPDGTVSRRRPFDCFFSLGGNDNHTTYVMVSRSDHERAYGAGTGRIGRITVGRHLLNSLREGEAISEIRPVVSETSTDNVDITSDLTYKLDDGYSVDTCISVVLDHESPASAEQLLILSSKGYINVSESTGSYLGCTDDMDVIIPEEAHRVRERGSVTVRCNGIGAGHLFIYREKRQLLPSHNNAGTVDRGIALAVRAQMGSTLSVSTNPSRALAVGMTQAEGERFLAAAGIIAERTGDTSDDAVIAEQDPEMTMSALSEGKVRTFGVSEADVFSIRLSDDVSEAESVAYFRKTTGLSHKPVGRLKVQFSFEGMPMITFYGDEERGKSIYPQEPFKKCKKGDIGITNQSRPNRGLIGVRLADSKEYGPTGEEPYGTNLIGRFLGDLKKLGTSEDDNFIYIREAKK